MTSTTPTESQVLGYMEDLSNWQRWGPDDELGTLNYVSAITKSDTS